MLKKLLYSFVAIVLVQGCTSKAAAPVVSLSTKPTGAHSSFETRAIKEPPQFNLQVQKIESSTATNEADFVVEKDSPSSQPAVNQQQEPISTSSAAKSIETLIQWQWPYKGQVIHTFKPGDSEGIEIAGAVGVPIKAAASGEVVYRGNGLPDYGNMLIIKHSDEFLSAYAHNQKLMVKEKDKVLAGQVIAEMGRNLSNQPVLHFEIRYQGEPVDPNLYLPH